MTLLNRIKFFFRRPKVLIIVKGKGRETVLEAISQVLSQHFKIGREILFSETLRPAQKIILVVTRAGEYHPEREFFAGELNKISEAAQLAKSLPSQGYLVLNFDDETVRDLKNRTPAHPLTFGFGAGAKVRATDVVLTRIPALGTNFKINYQGSIVPVWLEKLFGKEHIYSALAAAAIGEALDLNLVEVSSALKSYLGLPGRMRLIEGIKKSWILDDSESASPLSMAEAISVLGKINTEGRKIAVLGDILGVGKYTIEAHEAMGERAAKTADLLFTVGPRAEFIAQGAVKNGMSEEKIFQFHDTKEAGSALQKEMKRGDMVLIDGSKEMNMADIVEEVKA